MKHVLESMTSLRRKLNNNNQNKKWSDNSEVVWWSDVSDYSFEKNTLGSVYEIV